MTEKGGDESGGHLAQHGRLQVTWVTQKSLCGSEEKLMVVLRGKNIRFGPICQLLNKKNNRNVLSDSSSNLESQNDA